MEATQIAMILLFVVSLLSGDHLLISGHHSNQSLTDQNSSSVEIVLAGKLKTCTYSTKTPAQPNSATAESVAISISPIKKSMGGRASEQDSHLFTSFVRSRIIFGSGIDDFIANIPLVAETQSRPLIIMAPEEFTDPLGAARRKLRTAGYSVFALFLDVPNINQLKKQSLGGLTIFAPSDEAMSIYNIRSFSQFTQIFPAHVVPYMLSSEDLSGAWFPTFFKDYDVVLRETTVDVDDSDGNFRLSVNDVAVEIPYLCGVEDWLVIHGVAEVLIPPEKFGSILRAAVKSLEEADHQLPTAAYRLSGDHIPTGNPGNHSDVESILWQKLKPYAYSNFSNPEAELMVNQSSSPVTSLWGSHWLWWFKPARTDLGTEPDEITEETTKATPTIVAPIEFLDPLGPGRAILRQSGYTIFADFFDLYRVKWFRKQSSDGRLTMFAPSDKSMANYNIKRFSEFADLFPAHVVGQKLTSEQLTESSRFQTFFTGYELVCTDYFDYVYGTEFVAKFRHLVNNIGLQHPDLCTTGNWLVVHGIAGVLVPPGKFAAVVGQAIKRRNGEL